MRKRRRPKRGRPAPKGGETSLKRLQYSSGPPFNPTINLFVTNVTLIVENGKRAMKKIKILFVSANPPGVNPLKLDEEARQIEQKIYAAEHRDSMQLITQWAARPGDLLQSLNRHEPDIVHFSGHGSPQEELILLDQSGAAKAVTKAALVRACSMTLRKALVWSS
jgi:hypothetical protein